ncbi:MAG: sulfatase [Mariniblastus sp.]
MITKKKIVLLTIFLIVGSIGQATFGDNLGEKLGDAGKSKTSADELNILVVTVDDMSCDSVGVFGCTVPETTPNIDKLAANGLRYKYAHVQVGNCFPSRNVMFSGLYPHNNLLEGFYQVKTAPHPTLMTIMQKAGYFAAIRGKATHTTPYHPYPWDADLSVMDGKKADIKNADSYYESTKRGIAMAAQAEKPFFLNVNISDPHKPFYGLTGKGKVMDDPNLPSRIYKPDEVTIPGFLFDDPDVRLELAHYYSSVRRADDCFGAIMKALEESGQAKNTVIMFLSDHGMPLPFAKTALYHHSTRTPWIIRWPGVTKPNSIDDQHMISAVDLTPTVLEIAGLELPERLDGRSFLPTIKGEPQTGRDAVFKVYNENSGGHRHPMRGVQTKRFGYLFNPWSDGENVFKTATTGTATYRKMKTLAETDPTIAKRLELFDHRVVEEFYDYAVDPDGLNNLIDDPQYSEEIQAHRERLLSFMKESGDHATDVFVDRKNAGARKAYVDRVQAESNSRRALRRKKRNSGENKNATGKRSAVQKNRRANKANRDLFSLTANFKNEKVSVIIAHKVPEKLGPQKFHVTLKDDSGSRLDRKIETAKGAGKLEVSFELPTGYAKSTVNISAFIGEDYQTNLRHETIGPISISQKK